MNKENDACSGCFISKICSEYLQPERLRHTGTISKGPLPPVREACRHSTCDDGLAMARVAMKQVPSAFVVVNSDPDNPIEIINAVPFGTYDKPTEESKLRIVDISSGRIYSNQDGVYYPTGQIANHSY